MRVAAAASCSFTFAVAAFGQSIAEPNLTRPQGLEQAEAVKVNDRVYQAGGFGNTYLVTTSEGNVVVDTSSGALARRHRALLKKVSDAPVRYVILTHCHPDHVGGVAIWKETGTEVVAHRNYAAGREYQRRLADFFVRRNAAQYNLPPLLVRAAADQYLGPRYDATIAFDSTYTISLGGLTFELVHAPGETEDQINVWIPEIKTAFVGDNIYDTFPNIYTLRGTQPRWALDWIASLDRVIAWKPEVLLGSHMAPLVGADAIQERLRRYRDAIQYVHDRTVEGMNEGKSVFTLMQEVKLPPELAMGEQYGRLTWSIRGIYEGYVGWFDEDPASMYEIPRSAVDADLVELAGGPERIVGKAREHLEAGRCVEALHLINVVLHADAGCKAAHQLRIQSYESLLARTDNVIEQGWLKAGIRDSQAALAALKTDPRGD
jgi:alkyl sulfatase BDS1-like metallo-beta-lactamase superfamily hydrolase